MLRVCQVAQSQGCRHAGMICYHACMIRAQIQLEREQAERLRKIAARRGLSVSAVVREAVEAYTRDEDREEIIKRALSVIGKGRSGLSDVSERHDDYFAEAVEDWRRS